MSASTPKACARRLAEVFGLWTGTEGPVEFRPLPAVRERLKEVRAIEMGFSTEDKIKYSITLAAHYLPSLFKIILSNPLSTFFKVDNLILASCLIYLKGTTQCHIGLRFVREQSATVNSLLPNLRQMIWDCSDQLERDLSQDTIGLLTDLLAMHNALTAHGLSSRDSTTKVSPDASAEHARAQAEATLKRRWHRNSNYSSVDPTETEEYLAELSDFSRSLAPGWGENSSTSERLDMMIAQLGYTPWWACEAKRPGFEVEQSARVCDAGSRDELKTCARCLSVRYCSERHQKLHRKTHKPWCIAPTW